MQCRVPGYFASVRGTLDLMGALLAGDWDVGRFEYRPPAARCCRDHLGLSAMAPGTALEVVALRGALVRLALVELSRHRVILQD